MGSLGSADVFSINYGIPSDTLVSRIFDTAGGTVNTTATLNTTNIIPSVADTWNIGDPNNRYENVYLRQLFTFGVRFSGTAIDGINSGFSLGYQGVANVRVNPTETAFEKDVNITNGNWTVVSGDVNVSSGILNVAEGLQISGVSIDGINSGFSLGYQGVANVIVNPTETAFEKDVNITNGNLGVVSGNVNFPSGTLFIAGSNVPLNVIWDNSVPDATYTNARKTLNIDTNISTYRAFVSTNSITMGTKWV